MLKIQPYQESDFTALCAIFRRAVTEIASRDYSPPQVAAWAQVDEARWRQKMASSRVRVATIDHHPVGFIAAVGGYIDLLFVSPDAARQGVASALLHEFANTGGGERLTVDASITAKPFFAAHGFRVVAEQRVEARGEWFTNYRMAREGNGENPATVGRRVR